MNRNKTVEGLYNAAREEALWHVKELAMKIMVRHNNLEDFVLAMGSSFFVTKDGENICIFERAYMKPLSDFLNKWDRYLYLTGEGIRINKYGEERSDW